MAQGKLARLSTSDIQRELERRAARATELEVKRVELAEELELLNAEIEALGEPALAATGVVRRRRNGRSTGASITRAANKAPLHSALHDLLKGATMGVSEAAVAVKKAGYKTTSENFRTMVNITLLKRKDLFKKKGRGQYTAK